MRPLVRLVRSVLLAALAASGAAAAEPPYVQIRSELDRSAVWVGDRFHDVITVIHDPQVRFVTDNLQKSTLNLAPFEILNLTLHEGPAAAGRKKLEIDLLLATYEVQPGELEVPSFNLFYFLDTAAVGPNTDRPAETLVIPPVAVALRSTVPENVSAIRDSIPRAPEPLRYRVALPLAGGLLLLGVLLLVRVLSQSKNLRAAQEVARRRKQAQSDLRTAAARLAGRSVDSEAKMEQYFDDLTIILRQYLSAVSAMPTEGKTPRELATAIASASGNGDMLQAETMRDVVAILDSCERVRYSANPYAVGSEQHGTVVERLRALAGS